MVAIDIIQNKRTGAIGRVVRTALFKGNGRADCREALVQPMYPNGVGGYMLAGPDEPLEYWLSSDIY
jgi:hypothetical protein